ncbi:hypothetical protein BKA82DRAFT_4009740 [Pisolithus tinctorius]|nr:hypothetical protein BKA82DRAFT_4009740 [Pisolithus tinctorius]
MGPELPFGDLSDDKELSLDSGSPEHIETPSMSIDETDGSLHLLLGEPSEKGSYMRPTSVINHLQGLIYVPLSKLLTLSGSSPAGVPQDCGNREIRGDAFANSSGFSLEVDLICDQGERNETGFTCFLCSSEGEGLKHQLTITPAYAQSIVGRLDVTSNSLMELSAIPFLSHTPRAAAFRSSADHILRGDQNSVEDMLCSLVTEGELDFSFLCEPDLWAAGDPFTA